MDLVRIATLVRRTLGMQRGSVAHLRMVLKTNHLAGMVRRGCLVLMRSSAPHVSALLVGLCACKTGSHLYTACPMTLPHGGMHALSPTPQDIRFQANSSRLLS